MENLIIVGVGGFGREVAWLVNLVNKQKETWDFQGFIDLYNNQKTVTVEGYPILGDIDWLKRQKPDAYVVCALGNPKTRLETSSELESLGFGFATIIAPSVQMSSYVTIGEGTIICAGCILTTNITIGRHVLLNLGCTVGHDTILNDFASAMPGVMIAGDVNIGAGSYLGIGSSVIDKINIGKWSIIGGGAVVVKDIPDFVTAVGVPAKPIN